MLKVEEIMRPFYYTFGTDERFPYSIDDYVVIYAPDIHTANAEFSRNHPNRGDVLNCSMYYTSEEWEDDVCEYYPDKPAAIYYAPETKPEYIREIRKDFAEEICQYLNPVDDAESEMARTIRLMA